MEIKKVGRYLKQIAEKYKFVILVLVIGIGLMWIPDIGSSNSEKAEVTVQRPKTETTTEDELKNILSLIAGAGRVEVMLTKSKGEETFYQEDRDSSDENLRSDTVIVSDSQRNQSGLVRQILPPTFRGAVIVCEGAGDSGVKLAIVEAVSKATGLGADQISVLKMK